LDCNRGIPFISNVSVAAGSVSSANTYFATNIQKLDVAMCVHGRKQEYRSSKCAEECCGTHCGPWKQLLGMLFRKAVGYGQVLSSSEGRQEDIRETIPSDREQAMLLCGMATHQLGDVP
jgi:hypothetical protein